MKINARNAAAVRRKAAAEQQLILHKKGEHLHQWDSWNPNLKAMIQQEIIIEMFEECTVTPRADGKIEVATTNRRLMSQMDNLHRMKPDKCAGRSVATGITAYTVDAETWKSWLAKHTAQPCDAKEATTEGGPEHDAE